MRIEAENSTRTEIDKFKTLEPLVAVLHEFGRNGKILIAVLYGSFANEKPHERSDIDLGLFISAENMDEEIDIIDRLLMSVERDVAILRLDDEEESPFIIQEALKGVHLINPDRETLYSLYDRVLHESESIRFRREAAIG